MAIGVVVIGGQSENEFQKLLGRIEKDPFSTFIPPNLTREQREEVLSVLNGVFLRGITSLQEDLRAAGYSVERYDEPFIVATSREHDSGVADQNRPQASSVRTPDDFSRLSIILTAVRDGLKLSNEEIHVGVNENNDYVCVSFDGFPDVVLYVHPEGYGHAVYGLRLAESQTIPERVERADLNNMGAKQFTFHAETVDKWIGRVLNFIRGYEDGKNVNFDSRAVGPEDFPSEMVKDCLLGYAKELGRSVFDLISRKTPEISIYGTSVLLSTFLDRLAVVMDWYRYQEAKNNRKDILEKALEYAGFDTYDRIFNDSDKLKSYLTKFAEENGVNVFDLKVKMNQKVNFKNGPEIGFGPFLAEFGVRKGFIATAREKNTNGELLKREIMLQAGFRFVDKPYLKTFGREDLEKFGFDAFVPVRAKVRGRDTAVLVNGQEISRTDFITLCAKALEMPYSNTGERRAAIMAVLNLAANDTMDEGVDVDDVYAFPS